MNIDPPVDAGFDGDCAYEILRFAVDDHGTDGRVLHVIGELDTMTAPTLASELAKQQEMVAKLVVDLSEVTFLGSAGLAALVEAKDAAERRGARLLVVPGSRIARRALEATGLLRLFVVADDVPEALAG